MKMKHHFNVIIDSVGEMSEADIATAERSLANIVKAHLWKAGFSKEVEVVYVETFDAESPEEIRTHALVQDAMDSMEASGEGWQK